MSAASESKPKRRLLAVDDNRLVLQVVEDQFVAKGWVVERAGDGAQALASLERALPDAVVADVLMPVMDGWTLCAEVRKLPGGRELPFVFLTVESELPHKLRGLHLGADDYVVKPFEVEELFARVERLIRRREETGRGRRDALLAGSVEHLAMSDLLQILALNGRDGSVVVEEGGHRGRIEFESGAIVHAECGGLSGAKALFRMLGWSRAAFHVVPRDAEHARRTIDGPAANVLMDGLVALDEWRRVAEGLPPADARLELAADARSRLTGAGVNAAEFEVLQKVKQGATVQEIVDASLRSDAEAGEALASLLARGVVTASVRV